METECVMNKTKTKLEYIETQAANYFRTPFWMLKLSHNLTPRNTPEHPKDHLLYMPAMSI